MISLLLCLGILAGCSQQDSKQDAAQDDGNPANPASPAASETKALPLPPIPEPMDADAIMKLWAKEHDETGFMEEISDFAERPGTWKGKRRIGPDKKDLEQSQAFSWSSKWVNRRFMVWKFTAEPDFTAYSVMTYLPESDSYYWWETEESGDFKEYRGKKTERGGIAWEIVVWPRGEGRTMNLTITPDPDGLVMKDVFQVMKDGELLAHGEGEAHWMSGPGMELLSAKEIQELVAEPHDPNWETPEMAAWVVKPGEWKRVMSIKVRKEEEPLAAAKSLLEGAKALLQLGEADGLPQAGDEEVMERTLLVNFKHVRGRYVVFVGADTEGNKVFSGVLAYDVRANLLLESSLDSEGVLDRMVGIPDPDKGEVRWKSLPHEDHDRLFELTVKVSPDREKTSFKGKGWENGRLMAVMEGQQEWLGELPKEE
ncbi:MAG: hypothetical protein GY899_00735 [Verrucomicrobiaceae bacterium]|nr:hypothetical protein [Verrucomicrobiaceae bacterium]